MGRRLALPLSGLTGYRALITKGKVQENENVFIPGVVAVLQRT